MNKKSFLNGIVFKPGFEKSLWKVQDRLTARAIKKYIDTQNLGIRIEIIAGGEEYELNKEEINKILNDNERVILLTVQRFTTGVSFPQISSVFQMTNGSNPAAYVQTNGRGGTPYPGKKENNIVDFDSGRTLAMAYKEAEYSYDNANKNKRNFQNEHDYIKEFFEKRKIYKITDDNINLQEQKYTEIEKEMIFKMKENSIRNELIDCLSIEELSDFDYADEDIKIDNNFKISQDILIKKSKELLGCLDSTKRIRNDIENNEDKIKEIDKKLMTVKNFVWRVNSIMPILGIYFKSLTNDDDEITPDNLRNSMIDQDFKKPLDSYYHYKIELDRQVRKKDFEKFYEKMGKLLESNKRFCDGVLKLVKCYFYEKIDLKKTFTSSEWWNACPENIVQKMIGNYDLTNKNVLIYYPAGGGFYNTLKIQNKTPNNIYAYFRPNEIGYVAGKQVRTYYGEEFCKFMFCYNTTKNWRTWPKDIKIITKEENMPKIDLTIMNPPYTDGKSKQDPLFRKIWNKVVAGGYGDVVALLPRRAIKLCRGTYTDAKFLGNFPGVGQDVGIFSKIQCKPIMKITDELFEKWGFEKIDYSEFQPYIDSHLAKNPLKKLKSNIYYEQGTPIPEGHIGIPVRANRYRVFVEGEIPFGKQGKPVRTVELLKVGNKEKQRAYKDYLESDEVDKIITLCGSKNKNCIMRQDLKVLEIL